MLPGGEQWSGWSIHRHGLLDEAGGQSYQPHEIRGITMLYSKIAELKRTIRDLREQLHSVSNDEVSTSRQRLAGELLAAGNLLISTIVNAQDSPLAQSDTLISQIAGRGDAIETSDIYSAATSIYEKAAALMSSTLPIR